ncbi:alpha/beta hydrolase-fold protein, partial [Lactobacillus delbrueckii]|uniref:alpha/beta hydrolase-fold protein n=1 Tax=Lactobacillus delbrueckii TaxID=1584 RepID=UPI0030E83015
ELMPAVKARYRTTNETAIIGESLAGLFVMETLFQTPELFDTYIAIDPSVWWNHEYLLKAGAPAGTRQFGGKTLYVGVSNEPGMPALSGRLG